MQNPIQTVQDDFVALFRKTCSGERSIPSKLSMLAIVCGFRNVIRVHDMNQYMNQYMNQSCDIIMEIPGENISEGQFLCILLTIGIALFTDDPAVKIPNDLLSKLEYVYCCSTSASSTFCRSRSKKSQPDA
jgi:hypothetical protein